MNASDLPSFHANLLAWYRSHKRDLPFRRTRDPYKIWLSEIMLQQTTVNAVIPYYERFVAKYPGPASIAKAPESELLASWQGLGYYSRVRNFQAACRQVVADFGGKVPNDFAELRSLKGVGEYTAAAVASIAFGLPHAVVDGNVKRVLARLFAFRGEIGTKKSSEFFKEKAQALLDFSNPGDYNQAVMELGATVCRPKNPACLLCPVAPYCRAKNGRPEDYPVTKKTDLIEVDFHALVIARGNKILLKKPGISGLIAGMWELPGIYEARRAPEPDWTKVEGFAISAGCVRKLGAVKHGITNKKITAHVYAHPHGKAHGKDYAFVARSKLAHIALNTLSRKILAKFAA